MIGCTSDAFWNTSRSSECASKKRVQTISPFVCDERLTSLGAKDHVYMKAEMR